MNKLFPAGLMGMLAIALVTFSQCGVDPPQEDAVVYKNTTNTVYSRLAAEPDRLNPLLSTSAYSRPIWEQIFVPLLDIDPQSLELVPFLAKSRPVIEDITDGPNAGGLTYTFELIPEAVWDDGQAVTAEDVVFSFKVMFNPRVGAAAHRAFFNSVQDIVIDPNDNRKFTVITNEKYILAEPAIASMNIMPKHIIDPDGLLDSFTFAELVVGGDELEDDRLTQFADLFQSPEYSRDPSKITGAGPYQFINWEAGQYLVLEKKENWWGDAIVDQYPSLTTRPDSLVFRIIDDQAVAVTAIKDELLDAIFQIDANAFSELEENEFVTDHFALHTPQALQYYFVSLNTKDPILSDVRIRRALAHLVDVQVVIDELFSGLASRISNPVHPSKPYYNDELALIPLSIEEASRLLSEAGWEDSNGNGIRDKEINGELQELELEYLTTPGAAFGNGLAAHMKGNAIQAGIDLQVTQMEFRFMMGERIGPRNFQMYAGGFGADPLLDDFTQIWHTGSNIPSGGNRTQFGNAETDQLIEEIRSTIDEDSRNELYLEFQRIMYEEQPMIFLFAPQERIAISKRFDAEPSVVRPGYHVRAFDLIAE